MRLSADTILELCIEQKTTGLCWPHPWDHYPFVKDNGYVWLRYQDLDSTQRDDISRALIQIKRRIDNHGRISTSRRKHKVTPRLRRVVLPEITR